MKVHFIELYFPSKDHIICNYGHMQVVKHDYWDFSYIHVTYN